MVLPDVQNSEDTRGVRLDKVGICDYRIPFAVYNKDGTLQQTVGTASLYTSLDAKVKGANMSRYSQVIEKAIRKGVSINVIVEMVDVLRDRLQASESYAKIKFPFFIKKKAPVSEKESHVHYICTFEGRYTKRRGRELFIEVRVPYTSLCPCSKEMSLTAESSGMGAHNQRSECRLTVSLKGWPDLETVWLEDLVALVEEQASCPIWNTLKRADEKWVTEHAYNNPKFVEDVARDVALKLDELNNINGYTIVVEHYESIHQSNAVCVKRGGEVYIP